MEQPAATSHVVDDRLLVCHDLHHCYLGRYLALDGVSVEVRRGEKLALLGAKGSGKSTLLKVLDGLVFPDSGTYSAFESEVTEDTLEDEQMSMGFRSRVGFVFQNSDAQVFSPNVREEVAFGCLQLGMTQDEAVARVEEILTTLGIADLADHAPFQLSGGQKKKVAIAIAIATALVMNPDVLLFDEPTAALDPRSQEWLTRLIEQLSAAGKTIVLATHDLHALDRLADRCLVFSEDHRIVADGSPGEILAQRDLLIDVNLIDEHTELHTRWEPAAVPQRTVVWIETQWSVPDVTCAACDRTVVNAVRTLPGIDAIAVDIEAKTVGLRYDEAFVSEREIRAAIEAAGNAVHDMSEGDT